MPTSQPPRERENDDEIVVTGLNLGDAVAAGNTCRFLGEDYADGAEVEWEGQKYVCEAPNWFPID